MLRNKSLAFWSGSEGAPTLLSWQQQRWHLLLEVMMVVMELMTIA